ncbi:LysM peptidoglycan-binding domain-containing protein [Aliiroseovarius sp. 2305UL8-7]|uniref:LysM peptidoglycan-binding domain-containing protein n=1 Tax=Aliiroseovarius conchicola TaxID=3121637 RepID=UPI0035293072
MTAETGSTFGAQGLMIAAGAALAVGVGVAWLVWPDTQMDAQDPVGTSTASAPSNPEPAVVDPENDAEQALNVDAPDAPDAVSDTAASGFDVVRVDPDGSAVIAGHAEPGSTVQLTLDGAPLENVDVGTDGNFVALLDIPLDAPGALGIATLDESGAVVEDSESAQTVLIAPVEPASVHETPAEAEVATTTPDNPQPTTSDPAAQAAPQVLLADDQGIAVLQDGTGRPGVDAVTIDAITYDDAGDVALSGRAQSGANLRVYLDNNPIEIGEVSESGQWRVPLSEVESGVYTLRVDELAEDGTVTSRTETPFKREETSQLAAVAGVIPGATATRVAAVTVQPGSTLWAIAREHLGEGPLYVRVFAANSEQIKDPDLIYPGQVFAIPKKQ